MKKSQISLTSRVRGVLIESILASLPEHDKFSELHRLAKKNDADLSAVALRAASTGQIKASPETKLGAMLWAQRATAVVIAKAIGVIKSKQFKGSVYAMVDFDDENRIEYYGSSLPACDKAKHLYPNGWSLSDSMTLSHARLEVATQAQHDSDVAEVLNAVCCASGEEA